MATYNINTVKDTIKKFACEYILERDIDIADDFTISDSAVKKQVRIFKSIIKLDKNFHIYAHGNSDLIQQGADKNGKCYKIYHKEEN
jgi:hypothetical protein